jgi:biotin transport system substrate-specific component
MIMENLRVQSRTLLVSRQVAIVVSASLVIAVCARISLPLPFTPVPLTLANFAVLAVGLVLGSRRGFVAAVLYLSYGAAGMPVFSPAGPGGMAHLLGPSGGYLLSYPLVAFVAGFIASRLGRGFAAKAVAAATAEVLLFAIGVTWIAALTHVSLLQAVAFGLYPFVFAEVIKVMAAAAVAAKFRLRD